MPRHGNENSIPCNDDFAPAPPTNIIIPILSTVPPNKKKRNQPIFLSICNSCRSLSLFKTTRHRLTWAGLSHVISVARHTAIHHRRRFHPRARLPLPRFFINCLISSIASVPYLQFRRRVAPISCFTALFRFIIY